MKKYSIILASIAIALCSCNNNDGNDDVAKYQEQPGKLLWADGNYVEAVTQIDHDVIVDMLTSHTWEYNNKSYFYFDKYNLLYPSKDDMYINYRWYRLFTADGKCFSLTHDITLDDHEGAVEQTYTLEGNVLTIYNIPGPLWSSTLRPPVDSKFEIVGYSPDKNTIFLNLLPINDNWCPQGFDKATVKWRYCWGELPTTN